MALPKYTQPDRQYREQSDFLHVAAILRGRVSFRKLTFRMFGQKMWLASTGAGRMVQVVPHGYGCTLEPPRRVKEFVRGMGYNGLRSFLLAQLGQHGGTGTRWPAGRLGAVVPLVMLVKAVNQEYVNNIGRVSNVHWGEKRTNGGANRIPEAAGWK